MKTIGFPISHKENEKRRALLPSDAAQLRYKDHVAVEEGYGLVMGYTDDDYRTAGIATAPRRQILAADIICDPKVGDAEYLDTLHSEATVFGWIHAVQNRDITDRLVTARASAFAWEDMFYKGKHLFWRNNEIAGEAAIMHAYQLHGVFPYETRVAVIGNGNVARGAYRILVSLGAEVVMYSRRTERLLREEINQYDVIVNAVLWDTTRRDHIIYRDDLQRMRPGAMIIDISCDRAGGIETSVPTTIDEPVYAVDGVVHYVVDHTPSLFFKTISRNLSAVCRPYYDQLVSGDLSPELRQAEIIRAGKILDRRIIDFQHR